MTEQSTTPYEHTEPIQVTHKNGSVQYEVPVRLTEGPTNPDYRLAADSVKLIADQAEALEHARIDSLLGIGNRASFDQDFPRFVERAQRGGDDQLVAEFIDFANLTGLNEAYSHTGADTILQAGTEALKKNARVSDRIYRWGGDELFVVRPGFKFAPDADPDEVLAKRDHQLELAASHDIEQAKAKLAYVDSYDKGEPYAGLRIVSGVLQPGETAEAFVKRLDARLMRRKQEDKRALEKQGIVYKKS